MNWDLVVLMSMLRCMERSTKDLFASEEDRVIIEGLKDYNKIADLREPLDKGQSFYLLQQEHFVSIRNSIRALSSGEFIEE